MAITSGANRGGDRNPDRSQDRLSRKRPTTTRPKAQTVGRTRSASGTLTRPKVSPVPTPRPQPSAGVTTAPVAPPTGSIPGIFEPGPVSVEPGPGAEGEAEVGVDIAAIEAAITAIEAQFGLTREQLLADESEVGRSYRLLIAQVNRAREASIESVLGNAVDRGIVRSGIFAENVTEVEQLNAEALGDLSSQQAAQQAAIQTTISQVEASAAQAKLIAAQTRGGQVLTQEELDALLNAGLA